MWAFILKFLITFIAIASSLLFVTGIISSVTNPQIVLDKEGKAVEKGRNSRIWLGLIASIFWAIFLSL